MSCRDIAGWCCRRDQSPEGLGNEFYIHDPPQSGLLDIEDQRNPTMTYNSNPGDFTKADRGVLAPVFKHRVKGEAK